MKRKDGRIGHAAIFEVKFGKKTNGATEASRERSAEQLFNDLASVVLVVEGSDLGTFVEESFSARVPRSSAEVRRVFIHDIKEFEDVGQQERQGDKRDDEKEMR